MIDERGLWLAFRLGLGNDFDKTGSWIETGERGANKALTAQLTPNAILRCIQRYQAANSCTRDELSLIS